EPDRGAADRLSRRPGWPAPCHRDRRAPDRPGERRLVRPLAHAAGVVTGTAPFRSGAPVSQTGAPFVFPTRLTSCTVALSASNTGCHQGGDAMVAGRPAVMGRNGVVASAHPL